MRAPMSLILVIALLFVAGCDDSSSPTGSNRTNQPLAGGGRFESDDPFNGGPDDSGPRVDDSTGVWPPDDSSYQYMDVLFSSDFDCDSNPQMVVIRDSAEWRAWWTAHNECYWRNCEGGPHGGMMGDTLYPDSGWTGNCRTEPPPVPFDTECVVAISLELDTNTTACMRSVWISDIETGTGGTTVSYDVTQLDSTCCMLLMMPMLMWTSPVIAVRVPHLIPDEPTWSRQDLTHTCTWEPDPNEPLAIYYTDSPCDLGSSEQVITDSARWAEWYHQAWACDSARWNIFVDSSGVIPGGDSTIGGDPNGDSVKPEPWPDPGYRYWIPEVDFSAFAVIILRAGEQTRWGGGIWLNDFDRGSSGTTIDYSVMEPSEDCPPVEFYGNMVNPTVAIRLPLPLDPPITWNRHVEAIACGWVTDSVWVDSTGVAGP